MFIALALGGVVLVGLLIRGYYLRFVMGVGWADWTGFGEYTDSAGEYHPAKTLWDWMELLVIPVVLAVGVWWLNRSERENEQKIANQKRDEDRDNAEKNRKEDRAIADDRRNQATLEAYFDRMVELLVEHDLMGNKSESNREVWDGSTIVRTRTLAVLRSLDGRRKGHVIQFLYESGLIDREHPVVDLGGADLRGADLCVVNLSEAKLDNAELIKAKLGDAELIKASLTGAQLGGADLRRANLREAHLTTANLSEVNLGGADLREAYLIGADLSGADLEGANVTPEQLAQAMSLKGAVMPDGTVHG